MSAYKGKKCGGWQGGQKKDFKMEADHNWSPGTRLQGCAGFLVADMKQHQQKIIWPTLSGHPPEHH